MADADAGSDSHERNVGSWRRPVSSSNAWPAVSASGVPVVRQSFQSPMKTTSN